MTIVRELFISEYRYIENILSKWTDVKRSMIGSVILENHCPVHGESRIAFNNDYSLQFASADKLVELKAVAFSAPVLPNTLGADVFLLVDEDTSQVLETELLGGQSFQMHYFKEHIEKIEEYLSRLSCPLKLRRTKYCRIFVIENDICFLAFPNDALPVVRGDKKLLSATEDSTIACAMDGDELVYVDGWIRTHVPASEWKLEAVPVESSDELPEGLLAIEPNDIEFDDHSE